MQGEYNLFIALHLGFAAWAWFISVGSVGAKFARFHHRDRSPGRFAAAINQPPLLSYGAILPVDWRGGEAEERCWIVDPIDGTNNFLRGLPLWGVSIAHAIVGERVRRF